MKRLQSCGVRIRLQQHELVGGGFGHDGRGSGGHGVMFVQRSAGTKRERWLTFDVATRISETGTASVSAWAARITSMSSFLGSPVGTPLRRDVAQSSAARNII